MESKIQVSLYNPYEGDNFYQHKIITMGHQNILSKNIDNK